MPSPDLVPELGRHEITRARDPADREAGNRSGFKGAGARFALGARESARTADADPGRVRQCRNGRD